MFAAYAVTRWFSYLRSTALFLILYVLAVLTRHVVVSFGCVFVRFAFWHQLVLHGHLDIPWTVARASISELAGFFIIAVLIPLLPLYITAVLGFILYALLRKHRRDTSFWQRMGVAGFNLFLVPILKSNGTCISRGIALSQINRAFPNVSADGVPGRTTILNEDTARCSGKDNGTHGNSFHCDAGPGSAHSEDRPVLRTKHQLRLRRLLLGRSIKVCLTMGLVLALVALSAALYTVLKALLIVTVNAVGLVFVIFLSMCTLISFVLISGSHLPIVLAIGLEIVLSIQGVELETSSQEITIWLCFSVPLFILMNKIFWQKLIESTLTEASRGNEALQNERNLGNMFKAIPLNATQAAVKISDSVSHREILPAERNISSFVLVLANGLSCELRCHLQDKSEKLSPQKRESLV